MRVPSLTAWHVQNTRPDGKSEQIYQPSDLLAVALWREKKTVLEQIVGVERRLPPLARCRQKKTGSRYAPKTDSIAARIS
jgi:hypothetical protein